MTTDIRKDGAVIRDGERLLRILAVNDQIFRINETRRNRFLDRESAIVLKQGGYPCAVTETEDGIVISTEKASVRYDRRYGNLSFQAPDGKLLLSQPKHNCHEFTEVPVYVNDFDKNTSIREDMSVDGARADAAEYTTRLDRMAWQLKISFTFDEDEGIYGFGSHEEGYGNLRGRRRNLFQQNMKACVPMFVSTKGYGVLFDLLGMAVFHDDPDGTYLWADCADELDYYWIGGGGFTQVLRNHRELTGPAPMLPKWALGYVQSKQRYHSFEELLQVVQRYRREHIPLDCIVQDWQSWPDSQWGQKSFDPVHYPDPEKNIAALHDLGVCLMLSVWPNMTGNGENRREMAGNGCLLGNQSTYNAFDGKARALYWKQANEGLFSKGVDAWWSDCTEPFEADWNGSVRMESHERMRTNAGMFKKYLDPAVINAYSLFHSKGIYEGQRSVTDKKRVVNLTRSSYAGQHRYATITWSGDVTARWETLRRSVPEGCSFTATGEPYWSTDAGGFFVKRKQQWFWRGDFEGGVRDLGYCELYTRWLWYNAYLPMMRSHGDDTPREIWQFPEPFYSAIRAAIERRYQLLPYLYTLCAEVNRTGAAMLTAPALAFPEDRTLRGPEGEKAMMVGPSLYVCPVTRPMFYEAESIPLSNSADPMVNIWLPAGVDWYDYDEEMLYHGGQSVRASVPLNRIPTYVKAGSILPTAPAAPCSGMQRGLPVCLTVYPGQDAAFELYEDEEDGYGYENGAFSIIPVVWEETAHTLTIGERQGSFPGMQEVRTFRVRLAGKQETSVRYSGQEIKLRLN